MAGAISHGRCHATTGDTVRTKNNILDTFVPGFVSKSSSYKRTVLALLVGVTLALAGCSAGAQPTRPTGYAESGIGNTTAAAQSNAAALNSAGSWTVQFAQSITYRPYSNGTVRPVVRRPNSNGTVKFDVDAKKIRTQAVSGPLSTDAYLTPNASIVRMKQNGYVNYSNPFNLSFDRPYSGRYAVENDSLRLCNYTANGTTSLHGITTFRYSSGAIDNRSAVTPFVPPGFNAFSNTSADLYIDSSGVVRKFTFSTDAKSGDSTWRVHYTYNITAVGNTTVSKPNWASKVPSS